MYSGALSLTHVSVMEAGIRRGRSSFIIIMIIIIIRFAMQCIKVYATLSQSETTTLFSSTRISVQQTTVWEMVIPHTDMPPAQHIYTDR